MSEDFAWDDYIEDDGEVYEYQTLPEGKYDFEVKEVDRQYSKAGKPMCKIRLEVDDGNGHHGSVFDYKVLTKNCEPILSSYFRACGMKKPGEPFKMDFPGSVGKTGRLKIKVEKYTNDKGEEKESNKVANYYDHPDIIALRKEQKKEAKDNEPW